MHAMYIRRLLGAGVFLAAAWGGSALAVPMTQTIDLGSVYTGATPTGAPPWLSAAFSYETGATTGTLTLMSLLDDGDFVQGGSNANSQPGWAFSLSPSVQSLSCTSGNCADEVFNQAGLNAGPTGTGDYNLAFSWAVQGPGGRLDGAEQAVYDLIFADALGASPFVPNAAGYISAAHIQGIGDGDDSSFVVDGGQPPPVDVAEPAGTALAWLALMLIGLSAWRTGRIG